MSNVKLLLLTHTHTHSVCDRNKRTGTLEKVKKFKEYISTFYCTIKFDVIFLQKKLTFSVLFLIKPQKKT